MYSFFTDESLLKVIDDNSLSRHLLHCKDLSFPTFTLLKFFPVLSAVHSGYLLYPKCFF